MGDFDWSKVKNAVSSVAPILGTAVGGPAGAAVGALISAVLGVGVDSTPEQVYEAIKSDPESALKLRQLELEHRHDLEKMILDSNVKHREIDTKSIQGARDRDIALRTAGYTNTRADVMAGLAFASLCVLVWLINGNMEMKPEVLAIFNMSIGALLKMIGDVFSFEFGSSRGSKEKHAQ